LDFKFQKKKEKQNNRVIDGNNREGKTKTQEGAIMAETILIIPTILRSFFP
jgi:hypothetical protein